ncbi:MAG: hypothetical protein VX210_09690 [Myxococcota bacterium]|nr:hypothetical protein [Myxococcota bacterium]
MQWTPQTLALHDSDRMVSVIQEIADDTRPVGDGVMGFSYPGAWPSRVTGLGMREPVTRQMLEDVLAFYRGRQSTIKLYASPYSHPSLWEQLRLHRFSIDDWDSVLFWDLRDPLIEFESAATYEFANIDQHSQDTMKYELAQANLIGFSDALTEPTIGLALKVIEHPRTEFIGLWQDEACIATAGLEYYQQTATLITGSVLADHRRRGIQSAMIVERLKMARDRGASYALIASSPGAATERNALRLGARLVYHQPVFVLTDASEEDP